MTNVSAVNFGQNFAKYLNNAIHDQQVIFVGNGRESAVLLSAARYHELERAEQNAAYLRKIEQGWEDIRAGKGIVKTMEELRAMEREVAADDE